MAIIVFVLSKGLKRTIGFILALCACAVPLTVYFLLLRTSLIVAPQEERLYKSTLEVAVATYPEMREGAILTPLAAMRAVEEGVDTSTCATWGLDDGYAEHFKVLFTSDEDAMWASVYEAHPEAAVLYDRSSTRERALSEGLPDGMASFSYDTSLNSVTVDAMRAEMAGYDKLIVYSPEKVALLLRDDGLTIITQEIYRHAFELGQNVICTGPDLKAMADAMGEGSGVLPMPYRID